MKKETKETYWIVVRPDDRKMFFSESGLLKAAEEGKVKLKGCRVLGPVPRELWLGMKHG